MTSMKSLLCAAAILICGCSKTQSGENCSADSDCSSPAKCIAVGNVVDAGCVLPSQKSCENICANNSDCANTSGVFGATHSCGSDCAGTHFCVPSF
jgi:hypothetical protein